MSWSLSHRGGSSQMPNPSLLLMTYLPWHFSVHDNWQIHDNPEASKPFNQRGILWIINGVFDSLGFLDPCDSSRRMLSRDLMSQGAESWQSARNGKPRYKSSTAWILQAVAPPFHPLKDNKYVFSDALVLAIINLKLLIPVSSDPEEHLIHILSIFLRQKTSVTPTPLRIYQTLTC